MLKEEAELHFYIQRSEMPWILPCYRQRLVLWSGLLNGSPIVPGTTPLKQYEHHLGNAYFALKVYICARFMSWRVWIVSQFSHK